MSAMERSEVLDPAEVVISVSPRLFGDALSVALRHQGLEVSVCPVPDRRQAPRDPRRFDLAVTSGPLPRDVEADTVIVIPPGNDCLVASVIRAESEETLTLSDLESLLGLVRDLLGGDASFSV